MITKREALEKTAAMWRWLSQDGRREKSDYPGLREEEHYPINECYCCQYAEEHNAGSDPCMSCPLSSLWPIYCINCTSPYAEWSEARNRNEFDNAEKYALEIALAAEEELGKLL